MSEKEEEQIEEKKLCLLPRTLFIIQIVSSHQNNFLSFLLVMEISISLNYWAGYCDLRWFLLGTKHIEDCLPMYGSLFSINHNQ